MCVNGGPTANPAGSGGWTSQPHAMVVGTVVGSKPTSPPATTTKQASKHHPTASSLLE